MFSLKRAIMSRLILPLQEKYFIPQSIMLGRILFEQLKSKKDYHRLSEFEFRIFSQFGDDGIIQYLIYRLGIGNHKFIEFGVENYQESSTRFLLLKDNWSGLVIDASEKNIKFIQSCNFYWRHNLQAVASFITKDNINGLISNNGYIGEVGLLHIDIDGNDYWVWDKINVISPIIVIVEYNGVFGCSRNIVVPYNDFFERTKAHYSNLYWGASLGALCCLANKKGYYFVGSNSAGNNAYFVRKDYIGDLRPISSTEGYVESQYRESRGLDGELTYYSGAKRLECIKGLPVFNIDNNKIEKL